MFVAIDRENMEAFGPFDSPLAAVQFFLGTPLGREILGLDEGEWDVPTADTGLDFEVLQQEFTENFSLFITELQTVRTEA